MIQACLDWSKWECAYLDDVPLATLDKWAAIQRESRKLYTVGLCPVFVCVDTCRRWRVDSCPGWKRWRAQTAGMRVMWCSTVTRKLSCLREFPSDTSYWWGRGLCVYVYMCVVCRYEWSSPYVQNKSTHLCLQFSDMYLCMKYISASLCVHLCVCVCWCFSLWVCNCLSLTTDADALWRSAGFPWRVSWNISCWSFCFILFCAKVQLLEFRFQMRPHKRS